AGARGSARRSACGACRSSCRQGATSPVGRKAETICSDWPPTPDPSPPFFAWGEGNPAAAPCSSGRAGSLDAPGAEVGDEGGEDLSEVLRRRRRDKDLPRCGWGRVGGIAVENLRRLLLRCALDRLQARADPGELRRRVRSRRRRRQTDRPHGKKL